ncbi:MAG: T9SS type A sorting domain-containing protein, partial [Chitinophagaceae bacterium]
KNLSLFFLFLPFFSFSQLVISTPKRCGTDEVLKNFRRLHPKAETDEQFESWLNKKQAARVAGTAKTLSVTTLPVVFHIIHSGEAEGSGTNISQAQVRQQILQLNKDFANLSNSPYAVAANSNIQFALAQNDPSGNPLAQPGIDRISYSTKGFTAPPYTVGYAIAADNYLANTIKPATYWDPSRYINVWVLSLENGILGIATFPQGSTLSDMVYSESNQTAGIAISPSSVGSIFMSSGCGTYTKGKTLTHEMGHFFGLRHIWGDATCGNDFCGDTPVHQSDNSGVPAHPKANSCGTADEMFENYMDYTDDIILNTFTAGQVARMQTVLANSPRRSTLAISNVGLVPVTGTNRMSFYDCSGSMTVSETGSAGTSPRYKDYSLTLNVEDKATANATVTINSGGTAVNGFNYQVMTPTLSFDTGDAYKNIVVRVYDNALVEGNKTIVLTYAISGYGVQAGTTAQTMTINITDNDNSTVANNTVTLLMQDFTTQAGWGFLTGGGSNQFRIGSMGNAGGTGNAAFISPDGTSNTYTNTNNSIAVLQSPLINAVGFTNLQVSFKYRVYGEAIGGIAHDYGALVYSPGSNQFNVMDVDAPGTGPYVGMSGIVSGNPTINLPNTDFADKQFYLGFWWENDANGTGNNPGLNIDDVALTGTSAGVETSVSTSYCYDVKSGAGLNIFRSMNGKGIAQLTSLSENLNGVTASVTQAGTGQTAITTTGGSFLRSQKVFQISPSVANASASYRMTLYFTPAELAIWGGSNLNLKILKVKDGVSLSGIISGADATLITPSSANEDAAAGVIAYTADFTGGFSQFMLVSSNAVLPVGIITFDAQASQKSIALSWKTATERANKGFFIERSGNGTDFSTIGWVNGAGTSSNETSYRFIDHFVQPNTVYNYRLKQVDLDNRSVFSATRQAKISETDLTISLSPNPAKDQLRIFVSGIKLPADVSLVNAKGQTVGKWRNVNLTSPYSISLDRFARGYYTLIVHLPDGDKTEQVIIQ